jgi:hypothetical protein
MKNANMGLIAAIVIGLIACSFAANGVYNKKIAMEPYEGNAPTKFYAGMDKFISNVSWMTLVQWEGQGTGTPDEATLQSLYRKLDSLTNLDPLFKDAYLDGALVLAPAHPELAQELLDKGIKLGLGGEWKLSLYAALIEKRRPHGDAHKAQAYLDVARKLPDAPPYVGTLYVHWQVDEMNDAQDAMDAWYNYLMSLPTGNDFQHRMAIGEIGDDAQRVISDCDSDLEHDAADATARDAVLARKAHAEQRLKDIAGDLTPIPTTNAAGPLHSPV